MSLLLEDITAVTQQRAIMYVVGIILIQLAVKRECEPSLLLPLGFGTILINLPYPSMVDQMAQGKVPAAGVIKWLFKIGVKALEAIPVLLFIEIGAIVDFGLLLSQSILFLFGVTAQFEISATVLIACLMDFDLRGAAPIGIIGATSGPTSILVSQVLGSRYIGPIMMVAYSYMALVPIVRPFAIRLVATRKECCIRMEYNPKSVNKQLRIALPIAVTIIVGLVSPQPVTLMGFLMFGNLLQKYGVLGSLDQTAQSEFANIIALLLGITISFSMRVEQFVNPAALMTMVLGLMAFVFNTIGGVLFTKLINVLLKMAGKKPVSPMIGGCGISAFPMSSRMAQRMTARGEPGNVILMQATGTDVSGQVASVIAGELVISIVSQYLQGGGIKASDRLWSQQQRRKRMNMEHVGIALKIMGKGMGGIFTAVIIIMAAVVILGRIMKDRKGHKDGKE